MTDTDRPQLPSFTLGMLEHALRIASQADQDLADTSPGDPGYVEAITTWHALREYAAWREIHHSQLACGHGGEGAVQSAIAHYTDAVVIATRWADALLARCGITVEPDKDLALYSTYRAIVASFIWLIARDGHAAASIIYRECVADAADAVHGHGNDREGNL